jgi:hypothetical protein
MAETIHTISAEGEFRVCPLCGYRDGFHSAFRQDAGKTRWLLICPSCHAIFDLGYTVERGDA